MSESLNKIEAYKRAMLRELYNECSPKQQEMFNRLYISIDDITLDKIDWAIQQCERTIARNNDNPLT